jgi:hypothetical protein
MNELALIFGKLGIDTLEVNAINLRLSGSACSSGGNPEVSRVSSYAERSGPV